jgi:hypothetical protein
MHGFNSLGLGNNKRQSEVSGRLGLALASLMADPRGSSVPARLVQEASAVQIRKLHGKRQAPMANAVAAGLDNLGSKVVLEICLRPFRLPTSNNSTTHYPPINSLGDLISHQTTIAFRPASSNGKHRRDACRQAFACDCL